MHRPFEEIEYRSMLTNNFHEYMPSPNQVMQLLLIETSENQTNLVLVTLEAAALSKERRRFRTSKCGYKVSPTNSSGIFKPL